MTNKPIVHFLRLFLPIAAIILGVTWQYGDNEKAAQAEHLKASERLQVDLSSGLLARELLDITRDLKFLSGMDSTIEIADSPGPVAQKKLGRSLLNLMQAKPIYAQLRWLDATGQERVRVDQLNGKPWLVPAEKLQNKGDQYYFTETMEAAPGTFLVSQLDLNTEQGEIEKPYKPMLRLTTVITDNQGKKQGIIIANYLGKELIERFAHVTHQAGNRIMLTNTEGYWLYAPNKADEWGFMFNDATRTLAARFASSWAKMQEAPHGQFEDSYGLWTYSSIYPLHGEHTDLNRHTQLPPPAAGSPEASYRWLVVSLLTHETFLTSSRKNSLQAWLLATGLLFLFGVAIWRMLFANQEQAKSANALQRFIDHLPGSAYIKDADSRITVASRGFGKQMGIDAENLIGRLTDEIFPEELSEKIVADDAQILASSKTEVVSETYLGRYFESTKFTIPRNAGRPDLGCIIIDVTERKLAAQLLKKQVDRAEVLLALPRKAEIFPEREFMRYALEQIERLTASAIAFIHFVNDDGKSIELVTWSHNTTEKYCTAAFDSHYPIDQAGIWAEAARTGAPFVVNDYAQATNKRGLPEGHSHLERFMSIPVIDEGNVRMMAGVGNKADDYDAFDVESAQLIANETWRIVRRRRLERALRVATQVVNASPVVCFRWAASPGWPVAFVSENVLQWGYKVEKLLAGQPPFAEIIHPDDLQRVIEEITVKSAAGELAYEQEYRLLTTENKVIWVVDRTVVQRDMNGAPIFYDGVLTDITALKKQQLTTEEILKQQQTLIKRLEEAHNQLLQSEKMASIGQLAAGVAHELNNPIGFVHSNLGTLDTYVHDLMEIMESYEGLTAKLGDTPERQQIARLIKERDFAFLKEDIFSLLHESKDGLDRVRRIVQDLKSFSRVGEQEWKEADLHQGIDSTLNIIRNELKYKVNVVKEYGDIPPVFCLISQLNQVFMNLLVNAGQSIETQGTITIRTRCHSATTICIEISDTGKGIPPEHLNRIFDPFFTTKPIGKGTGLGLSLAYGIVERHQGHIEVQSELEVGTTFRVILPITPVATPLTSNLESFS